MKFEITFPGAEFFKSLPDVVLPRVAHVVEATVLAVRRDWTEAIKQAPHLWDGEKRAYIESLRNAMETPYSGYVIATYRYASDIENGRPARDLKEMLNSSPKTRLTAKGKRYMIIPFRHQTPGATALGRPMPAAIYMQAKALAPSVTTGITQRKTHLDFWSLATRNQHTIAKLKTKWGDRLDAGLAGKFAPHHRTDPYAGMVRLRAGTGKRQSSVYLTFRVMTEDSKGWIVAPQPGQHIARNIAIDIQPKFEQAMTEAVQGGS